MKLYGLAGLLVGLLIGAVAAVLVLEVALDDDDDTNGNSANGEQTASAFAGTISVGLTDMVPESGTYTLRNVFPPDIPEILAVVQLEEAQPETEVRGEWYQLGTVQLGAQGILPAGALVSEAGFTITTDVIDQASGRGGGRLRLVPNEPLPPDSYLLRVFVNDELARTVGFVVQ